MPQFVSKKLRLWKVACLNLQSRPIGYSYYGILDEYLKFMHNLVVINVPKHKSHNDTS